MCKYIVPEGYPEKSPVNVFTLTENILSTDTLYVGGLVTVGPWDKKPQQHKTTGSRIAWKL